MDRSRIGFYVGGLLLVGAGLIKWSEAGSDVPLVKPDGPDMVAAFQGSEHSRSDAELLAALCDEFANIVESDSHKGTPRIRLAVQLDDLRLVAREAQFDGRSLSSQYPNFSKIVGEYLEKELGTSGGKVDQASIDKWVKTYRVLADCSKYASRKL